MFKIPRPKSYDEIINKGIELGMNAEQLDVVADADFDGFSHGMNWGAIGFGVASIAVGILYEFVVPGVKNLFSKKDK